jgi:hypothetical protein
MKNLILFGIFVLFLVAVQFTGTRTADEIIEKHLRARGGLNNAGSILGIYMEGIITLLGVAALFKITKIKNELYPSGFNASWEVINLEGNSPAEAINLTLAQQVIAAVQIEYELTGSLINYAECGYSAVLAGKDVIGTTACYHLKLTHKDEPVNHYWISTGNFSIVQSSFKNNGSGTLPSETIKTNYKNYKTVNDLQVAHALEIQIICPNESIPATISFEKIIIEKSVEPAFFNQNQYNQS